MNLASVAAGIHHSVTADGSHDPMQWRANLLGVSSAGMALGHWLDCWPSHDIEKQTNDILSILTHFHSNSLKLVRFKFLSLT